MRRRKGNKKSSHENTPTKLIFVTAITNLITAIVILIKELLS